VARSASLVTTARLRLFYAYAQANERFREKLDKHLAPLTRQGLIEPWSPKDIHAGMQRDQELREHLRIADIILLLVSSDFLKSDLCNQVCVQEALIRYQAGKARILPIILEACEWEYEPFAMLAVLPSNNKPVTVWAREDAALKDITT